MRNLEALAEATAHIDISLRSRMQPQVAHVTKGLRIFMLMVLALVIEWPDWSLGHRFVSGLPVVGHAAPSNLFPHDPVKASRTQGQLLGPLAEQWNTNLARDIKGKAEADKIL